MAQLLLQLAAHSLTREAIAAQLNIGVASVYRVLRAVEAAQRRRKGGFRAGLFVCWLPLYFFRNN